MAHRVRAAAVAVGLAGLLLGSGCAEGGGTTVAGDPPAQVGATREVTAEPTVEPSVVAEAFGSRPRPTASPTPRRTARPRPKPTRSASTETNLPPPPPKPAAGCTKPRYEGTALSRSAVTAALSDAAAIAYWPNSAPSIRVPLALVKAVAWQESGWQSNIIACDGGVGLMQVMPATADYVNMRFDKSYDIDDPRDNAKLGANYLAWLIKYFGDVYFAGDYALECGDSTEPCLLNAVISAYNAGFGNVDTDAGLVFPNPSYVANVRALITDPPPR